MTHKLERISKEISKEISLILQNKLGNPNVAPFTAISGVVLSKDIKYATVYVLTPPGMDADATVKALNSSAGYIKKELALAMHELRTVPSLHFKIDSSGEYGQRIDGILKKIKYGDQE